MANGKTRDNARVMGKTLRKLAGNAADRTAERAAKLAVELEDRAGRVSERVTERAGQLRERAQAAYDEARQENEQETAQRDEAQVQDGEPVAGQEADTTATTRHPKTGGGHDGVE